MPEHESYKVVISKRTTQQLVDHAAFAAQLDAKLAYKLVSDFRQAAASLAYFPFRNRVMRLDVFAVKKYRKTSFKKEKV